MPTGIDRLVRVVLACLAAVVAMPAASAECRKVAFDGAAFTTCRVDLAHEDLRLFLTDPDGTPFGSFRAVDDALKRGNAHLGTAMNAGMYHANRAPVGLYVENGRELRPLVTGDGPGNFGLLPNGVFCIGDGRALVIESRRYASERPGCRHATQSGPMLVIDGALHPRFIPNGTSKYVRNGVGVSPDGREVWMAISESPVNFHHFARLFRDGLGVDDALYLDGNVSRLYSRSLGRHDGGLPMGPILGTVEPGA